jgi:hypothetical protein
VFSGRKFVTTQNKYYIVKSVMTEKMNDGKNFLQQEFTCEFGVCGIEVGTVSSGGGVDTPQNTLGLQSS